VQGPDESLPHYADNCPFCGSEIIDMIYCETAPPPGFFEDRERAAEARDFWMNAHRVPEVAKPR
jgi:hypothetical protein